MSVKIDKSGRRWVAVEVEVPGSPEQVWEAIATAAGITSWFVPTEDTPDGELLMHFGPGMDVVSKTSAFEPPRRFEKQSTIAGPGSPAMATEWTVEARDGGTCIVRVVHSLFASTDDWDGQLEGTENGWPAFFRILRLYLTHFPGLHGATLQFLHSTSDPEPRAWATLTDALGLADAAPGDRRRAPADSGLPALAGVVEAVGTGGSHPHEILVRLDQPTPGFVHIVTLTMGGQTFVSLRLYFYGDQAAGVASRDEAIWREWMEARFPQPASA